MSGTCEHLEECFECRKACCIACLNEQCGECGVNLCYECIDEHDCKSRDEDGEPPIQSRVDGGPT